MPFIILLSLIHKITKYKCLYRLFNILVITDALRLFPFAFLCL